MFCLWEAVVYISYEGLNSGLSRNWVVACNQGNNFILCIFFENYLSIIVSAKATHLPYTGDFENRRNCPFLRM